MVLIFKEEVMSHPGPRILVFVNITILFLIFVLISDIDKVHYHLLRF